MPAEESLLGREIGGYVVTEVIGEGGMAVVHRAVRSDDLSAVAIKVLHRQYLIDPSFARRFAREVEAAERLTHPSTVRVIDHGVVDGRPYMVMELLEGEDLFERLKRVHRFSERHAVLVTIAICEALEAAHALGIVHRDLKPENVMLLGPRDDAGVEPPRLKVLDFGIAKVREPDTTAVPGSTAASGSSLTAVGAIIGTPEFLSPEQALGYRVDGRADLYTCGVVLYRMITGTVPFPDQGNAFATALKHTTDVPPAPSARVPGIHPELERIILRALAKKPAERPASAAELRGALQQILPELSGERLALAPGAIDPRPPSTHAPTAAFRDTHRPPPGAPAANGVAVNAVPRPPAPAPPPPPPEITDPEPPKLDKTLPQGRAVVQLPPASAPAISSRPVIEVVEAPAVSVDPTAAIEARVRAGFYRGLAIGLAVGLAVAAIVALAR